MSHEACFAPKLHELDQIFSKVDVYSFHRNQPSTDQLRAIVDEDLESHGWKANFPIVSALPIDIPPAVYTIDFQKVFSTSGCDSKHLMTLEFCYDNRQVIVANISKSEVAVLAFDSRGHDFVGLSCLGVVSKRAKVDGGWNGAVGPANEYEYALETGFSSLVQTGMRLVVMN